MGIEFLFVKGKNSVGDDFFSCDFTGDDLLGSTRDNLPKSTGDDSPYSTGEAFLDCVGENFKLHWEYFILRRG